MSRELRGVLLKLRDTRLAALDLNDGAANGEQLGSPSPDGSILDPEFDLLKSSSGYDRSIGD
jgi:hypothetical protein